ncbi:hypothetical protein [Alkalihalobacterium elongatum]|uniref:hypothetical protein n=1 Tax=Alkalihalobacterium elongatum TaxID=2675466 RepID=UPI001C1F8E52|nr:hypothetical protein [Alkalihalobacterium elongatum]
MSFHPYIAPFPSIRRRFNPFTGLYSIPWHPFTPHKVELPKFHQKQEPMQHCYQQCLAFGFTPGTLGWIKCVNGCHSLLGSLLEDPQFIEDMMNME